MRVLFFTMLKLALAGSATAQTEAEQAFARAFLEDLQLRSFASGREYCGYFGYDRDGTLVAVKARPGGAASCSPRWPHSRIRVIASYHTHGSHDGISDGEVPSVEDVEGDMADAVGGYISTPGGRFWFVDGSTGVSRQLCGRGCLPGDPLFAPGPKGSVPKRLTLDALKERQGD